MPDVPIERTGTENPEGKVIGCMRRRKTEAATAGHDDVDDTLQFRIIAWPDAVKNGLKP